MTVLDPTGSGYTGWELLVCALMQLFLCFLAYKIDKAKNVIYISESGIAIFFGLCFGGVLAAFSREEITKAGLHADFFFFGLLPPIILESGFNMKKRGFFANFTTILLLAVPGTLIATFFTGYAILLAGEAGIITQMNAAEAFMFGSLISAVDPVATLSIFKKAGAPSLLFNMVFGESMLNDGVAIVSFQVFQRFVQNNLPLSPDTALLVILEVIGIMIGSISLAATVCFVSAFLLKRADPLLQEYPVYELSIILLSAYSSYVVADLAGLSGIVALFFSGVLMSHYHLYNISEQSATALTHLLSTVAFLAENFIFLYLGVSVIAYSTRFEWDWMFILVSIGAIIVSRAFNTFPLCGLANCGRAEKIPFSYMVVIWFAGLRGAIAFALALGVETPDSPAHAGVMKSATLVIVIFTTIILGIGTLPVLQQLGLDSRGSDGKSMEPDELREELLTMSEREANMAGGYRISTSARPSGGLHRIWISLDEKYLKPLFGGRARDLRVERGVWTPGNKEAQDGAEF